MKADRSNEQYTEGPSDGHILRLPQRVAADVDRWARCRRRSRVLSGPDRLHVRVEHLDGVAVVVPHGAIDSATAWQLSAAIAQVSMISTHVAIDLGEATFGDPAGPLRVLCTQRRQMR